MKGYIHISFFGLVVLFISGCSMMEQMNTSELSALSQDILDGTPPDMDARVTDSRISGIVTAAKGLSLSDEEVMKMAVGYAADSDRSNKIAPQNNPYALRLKRIVSKHLREDGLKLDFKVYLNPEINAFALANGSVRVYSGLMDRMKDDELLSVIGHEIGHVKLGHSKSQLQKAYLAEAAVNTGVGELKNEVGGAAAGAARAGMNVGGEVLKNLLEAQFSQSDEEEADDYGLRFLKNNGYDPSASPRALRKLEAMSEGQDSFVGGLFASHPDAGERANRIEAHINLKTEDEGQDLNASDKEATESQESSEEDKVEKIETKKNPQAVSLNKKEAPKQKAKNESPGPWYIQVAAPLDEVIAREMLSRIVETGAQGRVREVMVKNELRYRVLVGPYNSKISAQEDLERITNLNLKDGNPFVRKGEL